MKLTILNSGSQANGYVLQNETSALVIEAGVKWSDCLNALGYNLRKVAACIVTHEHGDHAKYVGQYLEATIPVLCSQGTAEAMAVQGSRKPTIIKAMERVQLGEFQVMAFDTQHDSAEPLGFLIAHPQMGTLLFATDTYYLKYRFEGLTQIMIECNYALDILSDNVEKGIVHQRVRKRTLQSHMSLETTKRTLQANNLTQVNNIILLHLSSQNSDPTRFKQEIELTTGKRVTVARKGVEININKTPF